MTGSEATFRAIADPSRRRILDLLAQRELSVSELLGAFRMSQPALSQHLRVLRDAELVAVRADGRRRLYRLTAAPLAEVYDWVAHYEEFWSERFAALHAYLDGAADAAEAAEAGTDRKGRGSAT